MPFLNALNADIEFLQTEDNPHGEECRACGDVGTLLCCDGEGCLNAFHGDCLEPPVDPDDPSIDLWYCPECEKRQKPLESQGDNQLMGALITHVSTAPPKAYSLPSDVRSYFEHVKTGDDGEYVETAPLPTNKKGAPKADHHGALKPPNFKELKDAKGNTRFCYKCNGTTEGVRDIIPCDFCPHEWHLDCLDPPLATAPRRFDVNGKGPQNWRCPLHADQDMKNVAHAQHAAPGQMGRRPRLRYPRKHISLTPKEFFAQYPTNNGLIDPVLDADEIEVNHKEIDLHGTVYKVPEESIKLDFIAKARRDFYMDHAIPIAHGNQPRKFHSKSWTPDTSRLTTRRTARLTDQPIRYDLPNEYDTIDRRIPIMRDATYIDLVIQTQADAELRMRSKTFVEQQSMQALLDLAETEPQANATNSDPKESRSSMEDLMKKLLADAPEGVTEILHLSEEQQLERLMALAQQRLHIVKHQLKRPRQNTESAEVSTAKKGMVQQLFKGKVNGGVQQSQVNGTTLGHDHGDD